MELTTIKVSNLTIDVETAKELFENLFAFFGRSLCFIGFGNS
jgi:hypothetical protein